MAQPSFAPVPASGEVRPTTPTQTPELARPKKAGLQRSPRPPTGPSLGTPAPGAGYALTIAHREVAALHFARERDRHDVELGVALVAAKRASLLGRAPSLSDVRVVLDIFGLSATGVINGPTIRSFSGLAHSYVIQRQLVDSISADQLLSG